MAVEIAAMRFKLLLVFHFLEMTKIDNLKEVENDATSREFRH